MVPVVQNSSLPLLLKQLIKEKEDLSKKKACSNMEPNPESSLKEPGHFISLRLCPPGDNVCRMDMQCEVGFMPGIPVGRWGRI